MLYFFVIWDVKYSIGWWPPIGVCRSEMGPQRPILTILDLVFCKKSMSRWIRGMTFCLAFIFTFFGCQGGLFLEASALFQNWGCDFQNWGCTASWLYLITNHHLKLTPHQRFIVLFQFYNCPMIPLWFWSLKGEWCNCCDDGHPPKVVFTKINFSQLSEV